MSNSIFTTAFLVSTLFRMILILFVALQLEVLEDDEDEEEEEEKEGVEKKEKEEKDGDEEEKEDEEDKKKEDNEDGEEVKEKKARNDDAPEPDLPEEFIPDAAHELDMAVLEEVEAIEERVYSASLQVKVIPYNTIQTLHPSYWEPNTLEPHATL